MSRPARSMWAEFPFAYRELGPNSGVPVILLHHLMAVLDDWDPRVIDGIAAHHRVIAFRQSRSRSLGRGSVPDTIDEMGRDALAFIRALGLGKVDLLGFSMGGGVAQMIALQDPGTGASDDCCRNGATGWRRNRRDQQSRCARLHQGGAHAERSEKFPVLPAHPGGKARRERLFLPAQRTYQGP